MEQKLILGVARRDITPKVGCQLYGYRPNVFSEKVNDNLTATAFVFQYGNVKSAVVSITLCALGTDLADSVREKISKTCGIPYDCIMLCATHTHSGPNTSGNAGWGDRDNDYCDNILVPRLLEAVEEACGRLVYVKVGSAFGNSYVGVNRREFTENNEITLGQCEWAPFNPKMTVISFRDAENKPVANIIHYGCHGTGAGVNHEISRDWPGVMTDRLEAESGALTAFINGPEGDVGPRLTNGRTTGLHDIKYAMEIGAVAGYDAVNIYKQITHFCDVPMQCVSNVLRLKLAPRVPLDVAKEQLEIFAKEIFNLGAKKRHYYERVISSYESGYEEKEYIEFPQTAIKLGDIAIVGFGFELFSEIGMRINKMSSIGSVLSTALTNGSTGYFPTEDQLCRGGYEIDSFLTTNLQPYAKDADFNLICETLKTLEKLN